MIKAYARVPNTHWAVGHKQPLDECLSFDYAYHFSCTSEIISSTCFSPMLALNFSKVTQAIHLQRLIQDKNPRKQIAQKLPTYFPFYCFWQSVVKCAATTKGTSSSITHFTLGSGEINLSGAVADIKLKHKSRFVKEMY